MVWQARKESGGRERVGVNGCGHHCCVYLGCRYRHLLNDVNNVREQREQAETEASFTAHTNSSLTIAMATLRRLGREPPPPPLPLPQSQRILLTAPAAAAPAAVAAATAVVVPSSSCCWLPRPPLITAVCEKHNNLYSVLLSCVDPTNFSSPENERPILKIDNSQGRREREMIDLVT